ncbi:unnamed protein product [Didymodactylos carnosus]|uniref:Uncharacterized protein n=1 Tax=Didymodactylos carnosus TaxID=1234261 RepID=A0A815NPV3_9BILA|nr:unnamed protein product [Didymodactylos carnosus]CAF4313748.1 unnamed protein product [Didymodactylos carnosus]
MSLVQCNHLTLSNEHCTSNSHVSVLCSSVPTTTAPSTTETTTTATTTKTTTTTTTSRTTPTVTLCPMISSPMVPSNNTLPAQCSTYKTVTDGSRRVTAPSGIFSDLGYPFNISTTGAWVRFMGDAGTQLVSCPISGNRCGAQYTLWYGNNHPSTTGGTSSGLVCYTVGSAQCYLTNSISVTNCNGFFIYLLTKTVYSYARYCTQ